MIVLICEVITGHREIQGIERSINYRASRDGFSGENFHKKCDGVSNTLTIIKTTNGNIFGAFAEKAWTNDNNAVDPKAFIISLINKENSPFKAMNNSAQTRYYALYCSSSNGPSFGYDIVNGSVDISIASDYDANQSSLSKFGYSFKHQNYPAGYSITWSILAGSPKFQIIEIEVFTKKD